jgi:hypothetical protein
MIALRSIDRKINWKCCNLVLSRFISSGHVPFYWLDPRWLNWPNYDYSKKCPKIFLRLFNMIRTVVFLVSRPLHEVFLHCQNSIRAKIIWKILIFLNPLLSVRSNGTDVEFEDCTGLVDKTCPTMDMTTVQKRNCKEDHQVWFVVLL